MTTIQKILLKHGMFSQDIRTKVKNGQIRLDGETIKDSNIELDIVFNESDKGFKFQDFGDFVFQIIMKDGLAKNLLLTTWEAGVDLENLAGSNIQNKLVDVFKKVHILRISKREALILIKKT